MFFNKKRGKKNKLKIFIIYSLGLILAVSVALPAYLQSSFLESKIDLNKISLFFVIANLVTVVVIALFPQIIKRLGNYITTRFLILLYSISLLLLAFIGSTSLSIFALLLFIITSNLIWIALDIILESASLNNQTGIIRTLYLTSINFGWILAPMLSAKLLTVGGYALPFFISALLAIPIFIIITTKKKTLRDDSRRYNKEALLKSFRRLWKSKDLRGSFVASIALNIFFSGAVLYIPIYLNQNLGIAWSQLGWIFSIMLIPFILIEIPAGWLADKKFGEKEMMIIGLIILITALVAFSYTKSSNPWVWAFLLFFSRVGAALVEAMRDTYFFKKVSYRDVGFINIFRMTGPLGYIMGAGMASLALLFVPINQIFITFALLLLPSLFFIFDIKDTK